MLSGFCPRSPQLPAAPFSGDWLPHPGSCSPLDPLLNPCRLRGTAGQPPICATVWSEPCGAVHAPELPWAQAEAEATSLLSPPSARPVPPPFLLHTLSSRQASRHSHLRSCPWGAHWLVTTSLPRSPLMTSILGGFMPELPGLAAEGFV